MLKVISQRNFKITGFRVYVIDDLQINHILIYGTNNYGNFNVYVNLTNDIFLVCTVQAVHVVHVYPHIDSNLLRRQRRVEQ